MTYRWENVGDWLHDRIANADEPWLRQAIRDLATVLDYDTIQDIFEDEMDEDGYFEEE